MIRAIMACDEHLGIGLNGSIPWHHKDDIEFFKIATIGHGNNAVIMGRKTAESLGDNFPLDNRKNFVISKTLTEFKGIQTYSSIKDAIRKTGEFDDVWIIGGREIYVRAFIERILKEVYITHIKGIYGCDTFMPISYEEINRNFRRIDEKTFEDYRLEIWEKR